MAILVVGDPPREIQDLMERRRQLGLDGRDEVWEGVYHMVPNPHTRHAKVSMQLILALQGPCEAAALTLLGEVNIGVESDFRIPDLSIHADDPDGVYVASCLVAVEVLSPGDETYAKFDFYGRAGVQQVLVADPLTTRVEAWTWDGGRYAPDDGLRRPQVRCDDLVAQIRWP